MDVTLILADAARAHPDNTFSLLRGGITTLNAPKNAPVVFKGALVARISGMRGEAGTHELKIVCLDEDGGQIGPEISGSFEIASDGGVVHVVVDTNMILPRHGAYKFAVNVDGRQLATWPLETKEVGPEDKS